MKTVFITGGSSGIGEATVKKFVDNGWNVVFTDVNTPSHSFGYFIKADSRDRDSLIKAADLAVKEYGKIDALFCNSGIHRCNNILNITDEELHTMIDVNIYGTINTLKAVVPKLIDSGKGSIVINCSDQFFVGKPNSFAYGLTKGALGQITRSLAIDLGEYNIRVNAVCAGTIRTPLVDNLFKDFAKVEGVSMEDYWNKENQLYARKKAGMPEEVAELVYFLSSDSASFCTGGHYLCDGGLVCR